MPYGSYYLAVIVLTALGGIILVVIRAPCVVVSDVKFIISESKYSLIRISINVTNLPPNLFLYLHQLRIYPNQLQNLCELKCDQSMFVSGFNLESTSHQVVQLNKFEQPLYGDYCCGSLNTVYSSHGCYRIKGPWKIVDAFAQLT